MANDDQDLELDVDDGEGESSGGGSKKMVIIIIAVLLIGGGVAAYFLLGGDSKKTAESDKDNEQVIEEKRPAIYVGIPNAITANLPGSKKNRTVQIKISLMVRSNEAKDNVRLHMPQLKNDVLMLVSQKNADDLSLPEGRHQLQQEALETIQQTLTKLVKEPTVEKVLFVSFVMQ